MKKLICLIIVLVLLTSCATTKESPSEITETQYDCEKYGITMMVDNKFVVTDSVLDNLLEVVSVRSCSRMFVTSGDEDLSKYTKSYFANVIKTTLEGENNYGAVNKLVKLCDYEQKEDYVRISFIMYYNDPQAAEWQQPSEYNTYYTYFIYRFDREKYLCVTLSELGEFDERGKVQALIESIKHIGQIDPDMEVYDLDDLLYMEVDFPYTLSGGLIGLAPGAPGPVKYK